MVGYWGSSTTTIPLLESSLQYCEHLAWLNVVLPSQLFMQAVNSSDRNSLIAMNARMAKAMIIMAAAISLSMSSPKHLIDVQTYTCLHILASK